MTDPIDELKQHLARVKRIDKWLVTYCDRIKAKAVDKYMASRQQLSPAAARLLVAMESEPIALKEAEPGDVIDAEFPEVDEASLPDPNPAPDWLNKPPPELPPGALLEVPEKARRRA